MSKCYISKRKKQKVCHSYSNPVGSSEIKLAVLIQAPSIGRGTRRLQTGKRAKVPPCNETKYSYKELSGWVNVLSLKAIKQGDKNMSRVI